MKKLSELPQEITVRQALRNVNKDHFESVNAEEFYRSVCLEPTWNYSWEKLDAGLKAYPIISWMCTDTTVGFYAVYLNDELVAQTMQTARRNDINIEYISEKAAIKVRDFLMSCMSEDKPAFPITPPAELDQKMSILTSTHFSDQQLESEGYFEGRACRVLKRLRFAEDEPYCIMTGLEVQFEDNQEVRVIPCDEFKTLIKVNL